LIKSIYFKVVCALITTIKKEILLLLDPHVAAFTVKLEVVPDVGVTDAENPW
jgi:hypothetical protein